MTILTFSALVLLRFKAPSLDPGFDPIFAEFKAKKAAALGGKSPDTAAFDAAYKLINDAIASKRIDLAGLAAVQVGRLYDEGILTNHARAARVFTGPMSTGDPAALALRLAAQGSPSPFREKSLSGRRAVVHRL